ncbi:unnamed protein product, partial [Rotaria magnacalcarata]
LELRTPRVDLPLATNIFTSGNTTNHIHLGYGRQHIDRAGEPLLQENDHIRVMREVDELRDALEKANSRIHNELRKLTLSLQSDFGEIKRKLLG